MKPKNQIREYNSLIGKTLNWMCPHLEYCAPFQSPHLTVALQGQTKKGETRN